MIRRLLATAATSAILLAGAIIALEAVGLLFRRGTPEPVIANVHIQPVPEETAPALLWKRQDELKLARLRAEEERIREADRQASEADEARALADALRWAEDYRRKREAGQKVAALGPLPVVDPPLPVEPGPEPKQARDPKITAAVAGPERSRPMVDRLSARSDRARSGRRGARRASGIGCPLLGWLQTVMAPPAPRRGAT
jgi:hypothetical protein